MLLNRGRIKLIVLDSIAALFRCEYSVRETVKRAKQLTSFGARLHQLSCQYAVPIICVNQVNNGTMGLKTTFNLFLPGGHIDKCCLNIHKVFEQGYELVSEEYISFKYVLKCLNLKDIILY